MRIYISAHDKQLAADTAGKLRELGHTVSSTWHDEVPINGGKGPDPNTDQMWWIDRLEENERRIRDDTDALLLLSGPDKYTGGKFVEATIAYTEGLAVFVLGRFENGLIAGMGTRIDNLAEISGGC